MKTLPALVVLLLAALACSLPQATPDPALQATQIALGIQQTDVARQQATLAAVSAASPTAAETSVPATSLPEPTAAQPAASSTPEAPAAQPTADLAARIRASNILIFEDIRAYPRLNPIVGDTVASMGFSGGRVINVGDALGDFKSQANSSTRWDLMIVAAELRSGFSGEMFEVLADHINRGGAVIIEIWYLDKVANGKIAPLLSQCGVQLFRDWPRDASYDPFKYSIYWLDSSHPLLSSPNTLQPPSYPYPEWFGDAGDLLELAPGGDAVLVGGLYTNRKSDYGVLATCLGGRMVLQTFSSHDYKAEIVRPLWVNAITYTLTNHYLAQP